MIPAAVCSHTCRHILTRTLKYMMAIKIRFQLNH